MFHRSATRPAVKIQPGDVFLRHGFRWVARRVFEDAIGNGTTARPNPRMIITADAAPLAPHTALPAFPRAMQLGFKPWEQVALLPRKAQQ